MRSVTGIDKFLDKVQKVKGEYTWHTYFAKVEIILTFWVLRI